MIEKVKCKSMLWMRANYVNEGGKSCRVEIYGMSDVLFVRYTANAVLYRYIVYGMSVRYHLV